MILEIYENCTDSVHAITESAWSSGTGSITELSSATNQTQCWWCSYQWFIGDEWMWTVKFSVHRIQTLALFFWCVTERALYKYISVIIYIIFVLCHSLQWHWKKRARFSVDCSISTLMRYMIVSYNFSEILNVCVWQKFAMHFWILYLELLFKVQKCVFWNCWSVIQYFKFLTRMKNVIVQPAWQKLLL